MMQIFMNRFLSLMALISALACSSAQQTGTDQRDGSTREKAVVVKSIQAEYQWVQANYPAHR